MTTTPSFAAVAVVVLWCGVAAQQNAKPDLSGEWVLDTAATVAANGGAGAAAIVPTEVDEGGAKAICGRAVTLAQTMDRLFIERQLGDRLLAVAFKLDGTQTRHPILGCRLLSKPMEREASYVGAPTGMAATASWSGSTLILRTTVVGGVGEVRQMLTVQPDKSLLVETTILRPSEWLRPVKAVYRKR